MVSTEHLPYKIASVTYYTNRLYGCAVVLQSLKHLQLHQHYTRMDFCRPIFCIQLYTISRIESVYRSVSNPFIPDFPIITSADPLPFYVISFNGQGQI